MMLQIYVARIKFKWFNSLIWCVNVSRFAAANHCVFSSQVNSKNKKQGTINSKLNDTEIYNLSDNTGCSGEDR